MQHEFANVFGIEESAFVQHKAALAGVERIVFDASAALACRRIFVEKPFDDLTASQSLLHNLGNVFAAHLGVENAVGHNRDQRSHLAKTLASAFRQADISSLVASGRSSRITFSPRPRNLAFELLEDLHGSVGHASGAGADDDPAHLRKRRDSVLACRSRRDVLPG